MIRKWSASTPKVHSFIVRAWLDTQGVSEHPKWVSTATWITSSSTVVHSQVHLPDQISVVSRPDNQQSVQRLSRVPLKSVALKPWPSSPNLSETDHSPPLVVGRIQTVKTCNVLKTVSWMCQVLWEMYFIDCHFRAVQSPINVWIISWPSLVSFSVPQNKMDHKTVHFCYIGALLMSIFWNINCCNWTAALAYLIIFLHKSNCQAR